MSVITQVIEMKRYIDEYHWYQNELIIHVSPCMLDLFLKCIKIWDWGDALDAKLISGDIGIGHFEEYLMWHLDLDLEDVKGLFKEEDQYV